VTIAEQRGGVWQFWYMDFFKSDCGDRPGGCGSFNERYRIAWTAEVDDSCVFDRSETQIFNGPTQWFATHYQWWQVTFTKYLYKSNSSCDSCRYTDIRGKYEGSDYPHPGDETLD
jgi:hypothetical protein